MATGKEKLELSKSSDLGQLLEETVEKSTRVIIQTSMTFLKPLQMTWEPKEDITTYELAKCLPFLLRRGSIMPYEINKEDPAMRNFIITE